ncbi:MAG TPA: GTP-binding protein [Xanthobacteraceae bacterium]|nr:GTP-binding protein [Xanthobacteraceae bacterium]
MLTATSEQPLSILAGEPVATQAAPAGRRPLVRIVIVGHVDHGKSTLIGRLLHETGSLPDGKLEQLKAVSARRGMPFEWSFLLDALQTERDQGITLDTTQIRFRTAARDFVLIDAPGHAEFLRNMITGASQADAALLIVDAAEGVRDQTRRHGYLLHLLGVRQVAVVINKMDRVNFAQARFRDIETEISTHLTNLGLTPLAVIPISAREGDGVARRSDAIAWYHGPTVIETLDGFSPARQPDELALRLPVQAVYKFDDRRIVAGRIETGAIAVGDEIVIMPAGKTARVRSIESWPEPLEPPRAAFAGQSIGITLDSEIFLDRGDVVSTAAVRPKAAQRLRARVFWLNEEPLSVGTSLIVRIGTAEARGTIAAIQKAVDPGALSATEASAVAQNHVGEIDITLARPLAVDTHAVNARMGRIVLDLRGRISGGGLVLTLDPPAATVRESTTEAHGTSLRSVLLPAERAARVGHGGAVVWLTGRKGSGKSELARAFERRLFDRGGAPIVLDSNDLARGLNADLDNGPADLAESIRRITETAAHLARSGFIVIVAAHAPAAESRARARKIGGKAFYEVHVDAGGEADRAFEAPDAPDLRVDGGHRAETNSLEIEQLLINAGVITGGDRPPGGEFAI